MLKHYYKIPIDINELFAKKKAKPKLYVSLLQSINQHLELLFHTAFHELRYDHDYGSKISSLDYTTEKQSGMFERAIEASLLESIERYEHRLKNPHVSIRYNRGGKILTGNDQSSFRVYIMIHVSATFKELEEVYDNTFRIFFSPLAAT